MSIYSSQNEHKTNTNVFLAQKKTPNIAVRGVLNYWFYLFI